ncbi:hypothetical protein GCM10027191_27390 [Novilysobacter erysipheiresistens]
MTDDVGLAFVRLDFLRSQERRESRPVHRLRGGKCEGGLRAVCALRETGREGLLQPFVGAILP